MLTQPIRSLPSLTFGKLKSRLLGKKKKEKNTCNAEELAHFIIARVLIPVGSLKKKLKVKSMTTVINGLKKCGLKKGSLSLYSSLFE